MDSPRPILPAELQFFHKGTGKVPLVTIFTKFDAQIIQEYGKLNDVLDSLDRWRMARENANNAFHVTYLPKVLNAKYPPKSFVQLEGMNNPEKDCPELTMQTANTIDDFTLNHFCLNSNEQP